MSVPISAALGGALQALSQAVQHHSDINYLVEQGGEIVLGHQFKIAGELNVALQFTY